MIHLTRALKIAIAVIFTTNINSSVAQRAIPASYTVASNINYIRSWDAVAPVVNPNLITSATSIDSFKMITEYFDGLGRNIQTVVKQGTQLGYDIVKAVEYDELGREQFNYLPFAANNAGGNSSVIDGGFKINPFLQQNAFMVAQMNGQNQSFFYGQTRFENSPLNRVEKTLAPGNSWIGSDRGTEYQYGINKTEDSVRIWVIDSLNASSLPSSTSIYPSGELRKTIRIDEQGHKMIEYHDKEGKIILKKVQYTASPSSHHIGWLCTYYIYDSFGSLRYVLQPKAVELIRGNWVVTSGIRDELCFYFFYDSRDRLIIKKVPGAGEIYYVYDNRNRLIMNQDSLMRANSKWFVTLYDSLNRPYRTGIVQNGVIGSKTLMQHINDASNSVNYPFSLQNLPSSGYEELSATGYDGYELLPSTSGLTFSLETTNITSSNFILVPNSAPYYAEALIQSGSLNGLVTWTKLKVLGSTSSFLYSVNIYDEQGRPIQLKSKNVAGGIDIVTTQYDFSGKTLATFISHQKTESDERIKVVTKNEYYSNGNLKLIKKKIGLSPETTIVEMKYDELGNLSKKYVGKLRSTPITYSSLPIDSLHYEFNIRQWLLGMNRSYAKSTSNTSNYFGYDLQYNNDTVRINGNPTVSQFGRYYNGNIVGTVWKSNGDDEIRKYDFGYDLTNQLLEANFTQFTSGTFNLDAGINYSIEGLNYDENGNILSMNQWGWKPGGSDYIDLLEYRYFPNSNKLFNVTDYVTDTALRLGDFRPSLSYLELGKSTSTQDYSYNGNGSLVKDLNKDIGSPNASGITYNLLNLPETIWVPNKGTISFIYDAAGNKLKKITCDSSVSPVKTTTTLYLFGTYINDTIQYLPQEEGRIRLSKTYSTDTVYYDYFIKDHLGNTRMILTDELRTDFYPIASMENVSNINDKSDPNNYIPYYYNSDYSIDYAVRYEVSQIADYPVDTLQSPLGYDWVTRLKGDERKMGPGIALKVMAGDKFNVRVSSWYPTVDVEPADEPSPITNLIESLLGGISPIIATKGISPELVDESGVLVQGVADFLNMQESGTETDRPKAFLNWILFDEQFNFVEESSGFNQVPNPDEMSMLESPAVHQFENLPITKNGYLFIYVSNETPNIPVYFDNLQVSHIRGPLLEETHYYPFGLVMQGISSKAQNNLAENKRKWNNGSELQSNEFADGSGLDLYATNFRSLDPQLGRFWQIDPKPTYSQTLYSSMSNNPISFNDPLGDSIINPRDQAIAARLERNINRQITSNNESIANSQNTINQNSSQITQLKKDIASGTLNEKGIKDANKTIEKLEKSSNNATDNIAEMRARNAQLNQSLNDIALLRSDVNFNYSFGVASGNEHSVLRGEGKNVIIQGSNDGLYAHEIRHIGQSLANNGLWFSSNPATLGRLLNAGSPDRAASNAFEVDAYQAQFSLDKRSYPAPGGAHRLSDINITSLLTIIGDNGSILY